MAKQIAKLVGFILLTIFIVIFFMYWLERFKILPTNFAVGIVSKVLTNVSTESAIVTPASQFSDNDAFLLEKLRIEKLKDEIKQQQAVLQAREGRIVAKEQELSLKEQEIIKLEETIKDREKSFNQISKQFDNKNAVLRYNVQALINMPPDSAVKILSGYDDQELIDTLVVADEIATENNTQSLVPYWLSIMEPTRVAGVQKKLLYRN